MGPVENGVQLGLRPIQVAVKKVKRSPTVDPVASLKEFDLCPFRDSELGEESADLGEFGSDPLVGGNAVIVASFDHE